MGTADRYGDKPPVVLHRPDEMPTDGRAARSARTMERIVHSLVDLIENDGYLRPTAEHVAARAGVSRRAVYLHFKTLDALLATTVERRASELFAGWAPPPADGTPSERVRLFCTSWAVMLDRLYPLCCAAFIQGAESAAVNSTFHELRTWMHAAVESVFRAELMACRDENRAELTTALRYATSCTAWADLRRQGVGRDEAERAMRLLVSSLLGTPLGGC